MSDAFAGKICVVTGAASGIGRALATALAGRGAILAISDINEPGLLETVSQIGADRANSVRADAFDIADGAAIERYAATLRESLGPADYLFNVAGLSRIGWFSDTPLSSFEKVIDVNFWGPVRMSKAFFPQLIETKGGVINVSSIFGMIGVPGQTHYCASKFALRGFNEALAAEFSGHGVRVTSVHPGGVATNIARAAEIDALPPGVTRGEEIAARFETVARMRPERAAAIILSGAAKGKRRVMVGADARIVSFIQRLFPSSYPRFLGGLGDRKAGRSPAPARRRLRAPSPPL